MPKPSTVKIKSEIKLEDAKLDAYTLAYIEYLAKDPDNPNNSPKGQAALDKCLAYIGWYECHVPKRSRTRDVAPVYRKQKPVATRLARLKKLSAKLTKGFI